MQPNFRDFDPHEKAEPGLDAFLPEFLQDRDGEVREIQRILREEENLQEVARIAHKWAGYAKPYGFSPLCEFGLALKESAAENKREKAWEITEEIANYLAQKRAILHSARAI